jgi:hypothetical protein
MNDSAIRLIDEVLLLWGLGVVGVVDVLLLMVWGWGWGAVEAERGRGCIAEGVADMCARQL